MPICLPISPCISSSTSARNCTTRHLRFLDAVSQLITESSLMYQRMNALIKQQKKICTSWHAKAGPASASPRRRWSWSCSTHIWCPRRRSLTLPKTMWSKLKKKLQLYVGAFVLSPPEVCRSNPVYLIVTASNMVRWKNLLIQWIMRTLLKRTRNWKTCVIIEIDLDISGVG